MNKPRQPRGFLATKEGVDLLKAKKLEKNYGFEDIREKAHVTLDQAKRLFNPQWGNGRYKLGKEVIEAIANVLDLHPRDIVGSDWDTPVLTSNLEQKQVAIDWHQVCLDMLEYQRRATSNPIMQEEAASFEQKQIYVPLSLVQRTKTDKRDRSECSPEAGMRLYEPQYEETQRFEHEAFLAQILAQGEGKTNGQQIALIGEPGAGKTTLLQAIAFWILDQKLGFPIWISLADLGRTGKLTDFQTYLEVWLEQAIPPGKLTEEVQQNFYEQINLGRVWLLCDGVDEVATSGGETLAAIASSLRGWIARSRVVLTCRLNVWQADFNALEAFETYRLLDFDYPDQVHRFIDNWFQPRTPNDEERRQKGERLKAELASSEQLRLRDLIQNPLRLALLCGTWLGEEGKLPDTKAGLYYQFVQQFYRWKSLTFPITLSEQQKLNQALGRLALRDINESGSRFRLLESFVSQELGDPDDESSLFYKALRFGWLNHVGIAAESPIKEKVYAFFHPTFEEYFAAKTVEDWHDFLNPIPQDPNQENYRIFEPQWKEVILLWLGREDVEKDKKEEFIRALVEFDDGCQGFYYFRVYFLAAEGIAEFKDCDLADKIVSQILEWIFGDFRIKEQGRLILSSPIAEVAKAVITQTDKTKAAIALVKLIQFYESATIYLEAAPLLEKVGKDNPIVIAIFVELIKTTQYEFTRWIAARILGEIGKDDPIVIATLTMLIKTTQDGLFPWQFALSLGKIDKNNPTAIAALVELIQTSQNRNTRIGAIESLGEISKENPTAIAALVKLIETSQDGYICCQAAESLGKISKDNPIAVAALVELIETSQDEWQAAESLGKINKNNSIAIAALVKLIETSQYRSVCWEAVESLGEISKDNPIAIATLVELIHTTQDESVRWHAAENLGKIDKDNSVAIATLVELIHTSQDEDTRRQAAKSLGEIGKDNPKAISALMELIRTSQDEYTRGRAAESLGEILTREDQMIEVVTALKDYLSNEIYENNYNLWQRCYEVIWHCAQTLSYPDFFQAWHYPHLS